MAADSPKPQPNTIRIFQTHDAGGNPRVVEYVQVIEGRSVTLTLGSQTMDFLAPLTPQRTQDEGVFLYSDPARGSGWLRLEEFSRGDAERVQELVQMAEIERAVGREPRKNADYSLGNALVVRTNNPWILFAWGLVVVGLGLAAIIRTVVELGDASVFVIGGFLVVGGIALIVVGGIRVRWWRLARAHARAQGGKLPSDLTGI